MGFFSNMSGIELFGCGLNVAGAIGNILGTKAQADNRARLEQLGSNIENARSWMSKSLTDFNSKYSDFNEKFSLIDEMKK